MGNAEERNRKYDNAVIRTLTAKVNDVIGNIEKINDRLDNLENTSDKIVGEMLDKVSDCDCCCCCECEEDNREYDIDDVKAHVVSMYTLSVPVAVLSLVLGIIAGRMLKK